MSSWEGANVASHSQIKSGANRKSQETVEAALNRLSKAYQTSMECVAAWHRADASLNLDLMKQVGRAARKALEETLLWDPLLLPHVPQLASLCFIERRREPPALTSAAHHDMVKTLAYLALVNYSDLLIAGRSALKSNSNLLLERGLVRPLKSFQDDIVSCWDEEEERTVRRALSALVDASVLDGSDLILWLKIASLARRLGHVRGSSHDLPPALLMYRRLETHALQMSSRALSPNVPPSTLLKIAIKEWNLEENPSGYASLIRQPFFVTRTRIVISRYNSWSTLARTLLRIVRGGGPHATHQHWKATVQQEIAGISTVVELDLAPILRLPCGIVGIVCSYLSAIDQHSLECTCKDLSLSVVSTRATVDHLKTIARKDESLLQEDFKILELVESPESKTDKPTIDDPTTPINRVSKRLRTQVITEGKRAERLKRRQSVAYCLRALMLRCNGETSALNETTLDCDSLLPPRAVSLDRFSGITTRIPAASASRVREETKERLSDSTLAAFLTIDWPISALGLLFRFASHISLHIGEIFASDRGSSQTLSSSLNECIELLLRQSHCHVALVPSWSRGDLKAPADANLSFLEKVAIDLLHGEQLLTRVEKRLETQSFSFDSEPSKLSLLVSTLCQSLQNTDLMLQSGTQHVSSLKVRIYWMTTRYLLWKCRSTRNVSESRSAEGEALKYLKFTIEILDMVGEVATPHLESEAEASYCKVLTAQSLEVFYNEITASSVILSTQEACLEAISNIIRNNLSGSDSARVFLDVGQALLERYHGTGEVLDEKLHEIVDDFLRLHGNTLIRSRMELTDIISLKDWFDSLVLSSSVDSTVLQGLSSCASISILSIMSCCLVAQKETSALLKLYSRLIIAICIYCRSKLSQGRSNCKKISLDDTDDESFNKSAGTSFSSVTEGLRKHMTLLQLLLGKIHAIAITEENEQLFFTFVASEICIHMVQLSLCLCADWFVYSLNQPPYAVDGPQDDVDLLNSVMTFLKTIQLHPQLLGTLRQSVVRGAANIIIKQTSVLRAIVNHEQGPTGQFLRQRLGKSRATLLAKACCMLGQELSDIIVTKSGSFDPDVLNDHDSLSTMLAEVCESLLCLWETALINELNLKARLMVPVATAIVGLCGFSGDSGARASNTHAATSATDIFDSDTSAAQLISETSSADAEIVAARQGKNLLCLLGQMVQAINGVFSAIDEEEAVSIKHYEGSTTKNGPLLPLVVARVLNWIADKLLIAFADGDDSTRQKAIWNDYPFGTRTIGALLDRLLYKAYKCLHRVILTNNNEIKDVVAPSCSPLKVHQYKPENLNAAIALYRCIMRAYSQGRKSPPKAALDVILDALPPLSSEDGAQRDDIQTYLFSRQSCNPLSEVRAIINRSEYWELPFTKVRNVFNKNGTRESEDEATSIVRRGISQLLAQGALPEQANDCDRAESIRIEEELSKKFNAILESLWLGDASDFRGWYKAAQCIVEKANLIADRIGPSRSDNHNSCFTVPERPVALGRRRRLPELLQEHENESNYKGEGWVSSIGANLSLYTRYIWSSFASLQACSAEAAAFYRDPCIDDNETNERLLCLKLSCIENEDVSNWQQTWGGLFVASLRIIATRCICLALYILAQDTDVSNNESKQMLSECMECLGVVMYSELSGCQRYGCPMSALTSKRKRDLAEVALECFARADAALTHDGDIRLHKYGLRFMQGKCHEKIANTFRNESFSGTISGPDTIRRYEVHMKTALLEYAYSLEVSLAVEKGGLLNAEQNGGSDHGSAEVLYRLHALRLKCLIYGVNHQEGERYLAETEALRLTEMNFYSDPVHRQSGVRERVWTVLTDVVDALARCRLDFSYFHRSVYRHAQALLWAPVLDNPIDQWCRGSAGTVSASKAAKLRGFNSSNAYSSAATVLSVLFEKRRPQLCAVWVTTGSASPFAVLNQTVRKYDRLRGKYILAYLNLLRLCSRRDDIETLMKFFYGAGRDLPSFFAASAKAQGGAPQVHHSSDRLLPTRSLSSHFFLTTVKRHANGCLAQLIVQDVQAGKLLSEFAKERSLKTAYSCFLRLNCSEEALAKCFRLWTIHHMFDPIKAVALSLIETYAQFSNGPLIHDQLADWNGDSRQTSLLRSSLNHSKKLFPNLSGNYYSRKPIQKRKRKASDISMDKSFDIKVPEGSKTGDSFVVTVEVDGQGRKVRLTVPDPVPAIMRFCLPGAIKDPQMDNTSDAKKSIT